MKAVQSLWTGTTAFRMTRGRALIHTLSCCLLQQAFGVTELVTDRCGLEIADRLGWNYTHTVLALDNLVPDRMAHIWCLGKLYAISLQRAPFCHVDNDVLLFSPLPNRLRIAPIFAQNKDNPRHYVGERMSAAIETSSLLAKMSCPYNSGVIGGVDVRSLHEYSLRSLAAAARISDNIDGTTASMVVEQYWIGSFAREKGIKVEELLRYSYQEEDAIKNGYCHLIGRSKDQKHWQDRCEIRLKSDFPEAYASFSHGWNKISA